MVLIDCLNLSLSYNNVVAIKNFSYSFKESDYVCIVGENGSGKSSMFKGILGLNSQMKKSGKVVFCGVKPYEIGYLPQKANSKPDFPASVLEVVLSGFSAKAGFLTFYSKQQKNRANEILETLNIHFLKNKSFKELSKGQQQRVLFARSVCAARKILFLDEPCAGFDPIITSTFYQFLQNLNYENKVAIVMITHDVKHIINSAKTIIHLKNEPIFIGKKDDYIKSSIGQNFIGG